METLTKKELTSPGFVVGVVAIGLEVLLFLLNRALPADQPTGLIGDMLSWVAGAAPWLIPLFLVFTTTSFYFVSIRNAGAELRSTKVALAVSQEKAAALERAVAELKNAQSSTPSKVLVYDWLKGWQEGRGELLILNSELERFHERALDRLRQRRLDGDLSGFAVFVDPFLNLSAFPGLAKVRISMDFWASAVGREYTFSFDEYDSMLEVGPGSLPKRPVSPFVELPWRFQPEWRDMVRICAIRVGSLVPDSSASVFVGAYGRISDNAVEWKVSVNDFGAGRTHDFEATSQEDVRDA